MKLSYNREFTVGIIAASALSFTAWAWGGVVLWTQWITAGLGILALVFALLPSTRQKWQSRTLRWRLAFSIAGGMSVLAFVLVRGLLKINEVRQATLQLIPNAELPAFGFKDWGEPALIIGLGTTLLLALLASLARPSGARHRLVRFPFFWLGLFLFAWITCQSVNPWGKVVQRDLFWSIIPQEHITWIPSGLDAPFDSGEEPGGMNGFRQLLIWAGPWALLCALRISIQRRKVYVWLSVVAAVNALGISLAGNLARSQKWAEFLGYSANDFNGIPFGPFVYKNHAGAYLYLCATLVFTAMFHLAIRRGHKVDRGGPHLMFAFAGTLTVLGAVSTMSFAAVVIGAALLIVILPAAYFFDRGLRSNLSIVSAIAMMVMGGIVCYVGLSSMDARAVRGKFANKQRAMERLGTDDRAPLREATWNWFSEQEDVRRISGFGAGSYRWISPSFLSQSPEFNDVNGRLIRRVTHAHNDWLQSVVELGFAGLAVCAVALIYLFALLKSLIPRFVSVSATLAGGSLLFAVHGFFDFLLFPPILVILAVVISWSLLPASLNDRKFIG